MGTSLGEVSGGEPEDARLEIGSGEALRILITGANGFVGRHLVAHLVAMAKSHPTTAVAIFAGMLPSELAASPSDWSGAGGNAVVTPVCVDLGDNESLQSLILQVRPHRIYHLAARSSGADSDREAVFAVNVEGTRRLLEAASEIRPFPHVLVASTGYVYGNTDPERPALEEDPIGPLWRYGAYTDSKIEMESVARAYRGFVTVVRSFAHTGPGQSATFALPGFAKQVVALERAGDGGSLRVGNLSALRDMMDVRDVVRAYRRLLEASNWESIRGQAFNVATGRPVRMETVVMRLCELSRGNPPIEVDPARLRALDISCSTGSSHRLEQATGWRPSIALETTLQDLLSYWRAI